MKTSQFKDGLSQVGLAVPSAPQERPNRITRTDGWGQPSLPFPLKSVGLAVPARRPCPDQSSPNTPNGRLRTAIPTILATLLLLFGFATTSHGKRPDLDTIFYGNLFHDGGTELFASYTGDIVVEARLSGVLIAEATVEGGESQFVLKVPMDDGADPRITGAARAGERIAVFVKSTTLNVSYEANESAPLGISLPTGSRGTIVEQQLTVDENLGGLLPLMAQFAIWADDHGLNGDPSDLAQEDSDNDGWNNFDEFTLGTDPTAGSDKFHILGVTQFAGNNFVEFGPISEGRLYTIWCSESLANDWINLGTVNPGVNDDSFLFGHSTPSAPSVFYRLEVDFAP